MIKLSDFIAKHLKETHGIKHFFMVSGGGAMHLNDSLGRYINYTAHHHEQACAMAAEGYARINQSLAVVNVTTGPGGINCLNGVYGQWTDSVPVLYISGQIKFSTCLASCPELPLRQLGDQEVDIISLASHLTKYAVMVTEASDIKYHLDKAIYEATHGRFGPVWLDIPMNIQSAMIDEENLREFVPNTDKVTLDNAIYDKSELTQLASHVLLKLQKAERPLIVAGYGIRLASQKDTFSELIQKLHIPVVTTFNGYDVIESDHPLFMGRIGTVGQRCGNYVLQKADCILFLGTRNNIRQVSYNWENFAPNAYKMVVDIDMAELEKPLVKPDFSVHADLQNFMPLLLENAKNIKNDVWIQNCQDLKNCFCFENEQSYVEEGKIIKAYPFVRALTQATQENDIIVSANGSACVCLHQVGIVKEGQRQFWNSGAASMGYDLPASIGAYVASAESSIGQTVKPRVICLAGDGSMMMNLQELQTIKFNNFPIKIFVINNAGYSSIRQSQRNFFEGRMTGSGDDSGVSMPDFCAVAKAFGIDSVRIDNPDTMHEQIKQVLAHEGCILCDVMIEQEYSFAPKLSAKVLEDGTMVSPSLEDMFPFIDLTIE